MNNPVGIRDMDLLKLTVSGRSTESRVTRPSVAFRFGPPSDPEVALVNLEIGGATDAPSTRTFTVGLESLLAGTAGVFAANCIVGWLSGAIGSVPDVLLNHFDPLESPGPAAMFAACFVTHAVVAEIGRRWTRKRVERFASAAVTWDAVDAGSDGDGRWVVGPVGLFEGEAAKWTFAALALWARNRVAVLTPEEFLRFDRRLARHGCVVRKYRMTGEARGVITTQRFGKLHSVDGQPAYKVMGSGKTLAEEWYRDGQIVPVSVPERPSMTNDSQTPPDAGDEQACEAPFPIL